jgi:serralysin
MTLIRTVKVEEVAPEWTNHANIKFQFVNDGDAEIRVAFEELGGNWSYVGIRSASFAQKEHTMNISPKTPEADLQKVILHEFGHALGCIHEHQSPVNAIPWHKPNVYEWYHQQFKWSSNDVDQNIFLRGDGAEHTDFDPDSIMMYEVPSELTRTGVSFTGGSTLSAGDKKWIAKMYPF